MNVDAVNRAFWRAGWSAGPALLRGRAVRSALARSAARLAVGEHAPDVVTRHLEQWRSNVSTATGRAPTELEVAAAVRSYVRTVTESLVLPTWSRAETVRRVTTDPLGERRVREAMAGPGAVIALPHIGSWDHAGAWACATGMPVATVAEQLGEAEFAAFRAYRERLGFRIYSHREPGVLAALCGDVRAGRLVCLVADRVFDGRGLAATWPVAATGERVPVRAAGGPAMIARRTGAVLMGVAAHYTETGIHMTFSDPVEHRPGLAGLVAMTQDVVDFFAGEVATGYVDWHVFQPFFDEPVA